MADTGTPNPRGPGNRARVVAVAVALLVVGYFAVDMLGTDRGSPAAGSGPTAPTGSEENGFTPLEPAAFAARLAAPSAFVANVHVPYAGEIAGTDAFIPYDRIADGSLPADRNAEILLYCRSGRMSQLAAGALLRAGYTNVADLQGGMEAWQAAGRPLRFQPGANGR